MSNWPLAIPHQDARRIFTRRATILVLTRHIKPGVHDLHDSLSIQRNDRLRRTGRSDEQTDPLVATIDIVNVDARPLSGLNLRIVMAAGFRTQRDFYDNWLARRGRIDPDMPVRVCEFGLVDPGRFLHVKPWKGYTRNSWEGVRGEPEALGVVELAELAGAAGRRFERERQREVDRRRARSIAARVRDAARREDWGEWLRLSAELAELARARLAA